MADERFLMAGESFSASLSTCDKGEREEGREGRKGREVAGGGREKKESKDEGAG